MAAINGQSIWGTISVGLVGAFLGMTTAWWTALQDKGVTRKDMEDYVKNYSPYVMDRSMISEHQSVQYQQIGHMSGVQQEVLKRLDKLENASK